MIGCWGMDRFIGALVIAGLNIGESIMVPRFGAAIANEGMLPKKLLKPILKTHLSLLSSFRSFSYRILLQEHLKYSSQRKPCFFQYIQTALAVLVLRKKLIQIKSSLPRSIWPSNPNPSSS